MSQTTTPSGDAYRKARELLAAEYDRDDLPFVADCIRTDAMLARTEERAIRAIVAAMIARNAELEADAARWREVSDKAWFIDAAAYVYGLRTGTFEPTPDEDEVIAAVDAARTPAKGDAS